MVDKIGDNYLYEDVDSACWRSWVRHWALKRVPLGKRKVILDNPTAKWFNCFTCDFWSLFLCILPLWHGTGPEQLRVSPWLLIWREPHGSSLSCLSSEVTVGAKGTCPPRVLSSSLPAPLNWWLVSYCCCNRSPQTQWLKAMQIYCLIVLGSEVQTGVVGRIALFLETPGSLLHAFSAFEMYVLLGSCFFSSPFGQRWLEVCFLCGRWTLLPPAYPLKDTWLLTLRLT